MVGDRCHHRCHHGRDRHVHRARDTIALVAWLARAVQRESVVALARGELAARVGLAQIDYYIWKVSHAEVFYT